MKQQGEIITVNLSANAATQSRTLPTGVSVNAEGEIRVAAKCKLTAPLHLHFGQRGADATPIQCRLRLEKGADCVVLVKHQSANDWQIEYDIELAAGARLVLGADTHTPGIDVTCDQRIQVKQAAQSAFYHHQHLTEGAGSLKCQMKIDLLDAKASCQLNGVYQLEGAQLAEYAIQINHHHSDTHSEQLYKGILDGHARARFQGKVIVRQDAQQITAAQSNHNLLLSQSALVETQPELEIYADDVKCSHGATVGQLDQDALFYLRARGIGEVAARQMLMRGFIQEVLLRAEQDFGSLGYIGEVEEVVDAAGA